jgi:hypothetical protein
MPLAQEEIDDSLGKIPAVREKRRLRASAVVALFEAKTGKEVGFRLITSIEVIEKKVSPKRTLLLPKV